MNGEFVSITKLMFFHNTIYWLQIQYQAKKNQVPSQRDDFNPNKKLIEL